MSARFRIPRQSALRCALRSKHRPCITPSRGVGGSTTEVCICSRDFTRRLRSTDPDLRDLMVSCGAALHHCVVALAALAGTRRSIGFPTLTIPASGPIDVLPQTPGEVDIILAGCDQGRRSDRRHYSSWLRPGGDILMGGARRAGGVMLRQIDLHPD